MELFGPPPDPELVGSQSRTKRRTKISRWVGLFGVFPEFDVGSGSHILG